MKKLTPFLPEQLLWIKSVTRDRGNAWAYMDKNVGETFELNFSKSPKWYPTNYEKAKPGELMALFQTIKHPSKPRGDWYVTHLVTPLDEAILTLPEGGSHPYIRMMAVIGKNDSPIPVDAGIWSLFKCNRGQICTINTVEHRAKPALSIAQKQQFIFSLFTDIDTALLQQIITFAETLPDEEIPVEEGAERTLLKLHRFKERNRKKIAEAKQKAREQNRLFCEICTFNFETEYPGLGQGFIECHHKLPIASGGIRKTRVEDLAIVCANCHRMLHKKNSLGNYYSVDELKILIQSRK